MRSVHALFVLCSFNAAVRYVFAQYMSPNTTTVVHAESVSFAERQLDITGGSMILRRGRFFLYNELMALDIVNLKPEKRCALDFLQANLSPVEYQVFTCEFHGAINADGCGENIDLAAVASSLQFFAEDESPWRVGAVENLQELFVSSKSLAWNKFIAYWRQDERCRVEFSLYSELKGLDNDNLEPQKRCALDFLEANLNHTEYGKFTCDFYDLIDQGAGCGANIDLETAALFLKDYGLTYEMDALDKLQDLFMSSMPLEWKSFLGYWRGEYICEFLLINVMKFLVFDSKHIDYGKQECALEYIEYHTQMEEYYKSFSCEFQALTAGCGVESLTLRAAAGAYQSGPTSYQIKALNRLQENMESLNSGEWSKFIAYWRQLEDCSYSLPTLKIVHLGDSYSAGNGASGAEEATQPKGCHRNVNNWGQQVARMLQESCNVQYINKACHGGVVSSILSTTETEVLKEKKVTSCPPDSEEVYYRETSLTHCKGKIRPQIDNVDKSVDVVFLTIGGNDLKFSTIVKDCLVLYTNHCACDQLLNFVYAMLTRGKMAQMIQQVFGALRGKMRSDARIVYSTYPHLVPEGFKKRFYCHGWFDAIKRIRELENLFEEVQRRAVEEFNEEVGEEFVVLYDGTKAIFQGHEPLPYFNDYGPELALSFLRDTKIWVHDLRVVGNVVPDYWNALEIYMAYHPNDEGHKAWARGIYEGLLPHFSAFSLNEELLDRKASLDLAIVLSTTSSMESVYNQLVLQLNNIFDSLEAKTSYHRVAVVSYKDFSEGTTDPFGIARPATVVQSFTDDIEEVRRALQGIEISGGYDPNEAVFSGINIALQELSWRTGAVKMLTVIGDSPPKLDLSFELPTEYISKITRDEIVKTSFRLDPVQIITVDSGTMTLDGVMVEISSATGGMTIGLDSAGEALGAKLDLVLSKTTQQPFVWIGESYSGRVGDTIKFDARGSYDPTGNRITNYTWDFDGDGVNDQTTADPVVDHVYDQSFDGMVYVSAVNNVGLQGLASGKVKIYEKDYVNTLPECAIDDAGMPVIVGDAGFLDCRVSDSMVFMKANPQFVQACEACFHELEGTDNGIMLQNAYETGNSTAFAATLCNVGATDNGSKARRLKPKGKHNDQQAGHKNIKKAKQKTDSSGTKARTRYGGVACQTLQSSFDGMGMCPTNPVII